MKRNYVVCGVMAFGLVAAGGPARAKKFTLDTAPVKQGRIFVDEKFLGIAPVTVDLKVSRRSVMKARAEKGGALGLWSTEFTKDQRQIVMIRLEEDEASKQTVASDIANKWLTIDPSTTGGAQKVTDEGEAWKKIGFPHDRAAIDVTELHMAPTLPHAFEACFPQSPDDFGPRDNRDRRCHAESSTVAMIGGSTPCGSGMSSK